MIPGIVAGHAVPGLWTPADLSSPPGFWVDDNSTMVITSSPMVDSWGDRSGNARHAAASGGQRPSLASSPWRVEYAVGNRSEIANPGALLNSVSSAWVFGVWRRTSPDDSNISRPVVAWGNNGSAVRLGLYAGENVAGGANRIGIGARRLDAEDYSYFGAAAAHTSGDWVMGLGLVDYSARTVDLWIDGELDSNYSGAFTGSGSTSATNSARARIGSNAATSVLPSLDGSVRCALIGVALPGAGEVDELFGWAAWHFGLESNLPISHPYKDAPPYR